MHRTSRLPRLWLGKILFVTLLLIAAFTAQAQMPEGGASVLIVPVNQTRTVEMSTKKPIMEVRTDNPKIASVKTVIGDPTRVMVTGLSNGSTMVTLIESKDRSETFEVRVPADDEVVRQENRRKLLELIRQSVPTAAVDVIASPNNTVVLTGTADNVEHVNTLMELARSFFGGNANVVNNIRLGGVHQVQVEVTIARVNRSEFRSFGFSFLETGQRHFLASTVGGAGSLAGSIASGVLSPAASLSATPNAVFGIINDKQGFVGFLTALRTEGIAKLDAHPFATTMSGRPGNVVSGGETPILTSSGQGAPNVTYKAFGTVVNFLPIVKGNGKIHLEVRASVSNIDQAAGITIPSGVGVTSIPGFAVRSAEAAVVLEDGQTLAIGGLVQNTINGTTSKVPVLGDLPFLGAAFSTKSYTETEEELLILVTPRLVEGMACNQLPQYLPGRETRSPDDFELFLEGILEAPRGQRNPCPNGICSYTAAHRTGPTAGAYPCNDGTQPCNWFRGRTYGPNCGPTCGPNGCTPSYPGMANDSILTREMPVGPAPTPPVLEREQAAPLPRINAPVNELPPTSQTPERDILLPPASIGVPTGGEER